MIVRKHRGRGEAFVWKREERVALVERRSRIVEDTIVEALALRAGDRAAR